MVALEGPAPATTPAAGNRESCKLRWSDVSATAFPLDAWA
jgi:hypothetical protein